MNISTEYVHALDGAEKKKVKLKDDNVKNSLIKYINDNNNNVEINTVIGSIGTSN